jgi:heme/copper-type cytochrome/quinol oxidase subunit 1
VGQEDHSLILRDTKKYENRGLRFNSVSFWLMVVLFLFACVDVAGFASSLWIFYHPTPQAPVQPDINL